MIREIISYSSVCLEYYDSTTTARLQLAAIINYVSRGKSSRLKVIVNMLLSS